LLWYKNFTIIKDQLQPQQKGLKQYENRKSLTIICKNALDYFGYVAKTEQGIFMVALLGLSLQAI